MARKARGAGFKLTDAGFKMWLIPNFVTETAIP